MISVIRSNDSTLNNIHFVHFVMNRSIEQCNQGANKIEKFIEYHWLKLWNMIVVRLRYCAPTIWGK